MPIFVVAVEYRGADLPPHRGAARRPIREHAYDVETGTLAHTRVRQASDLGDVTAGDTRVGFEQPAPGWPRRPQAPRCPACTAVVADLVIDLIRHALTQLTPSSVTAEPSWHPGRRRGRLRLYRRNNS